MPRSLGRCHGAAEEALEALHETALQHLRRPEVPARSNAAIERDRQAAAVQALSLDGAPSRFPQDLSRTWSQATARPAVPAIQPGPDRRPPLVPHARDQ